MDPRVAQKLARNAAQGISYPNPGARAVIAPELARFQSKMDRHLAQQAAAAEAKPEPAAEAKAEAPAEPQPGKGRGKG